MRAPRLVLALCSPLLCSACARSCGADPSAKPVEPRAAVALTAPQSASEVKAKAAPEADVRPGRDSCAGIGAVACDVAPSGDSPAELCAQVSKCLLNKGNQDDEFGVITAVEDCEALASVSAAPASSGLSSIGFVTLTGELGEVPAEGTFLFARNNAGLCLVDRVLNMEWFHGGSFENELTTRWDGNALHIQAQRLKRIPVDQSEADSPGADVDWVTCDRHVYEAREGKLERVKTESSDKRCKKRGR